MDVQKLFQVLVVGGAMLSGSPLAAQGERLGIDGTETAEWLSALSASDEAAALDDELQPIFCNRPEACVAGPGGTKVAKPGFACCWNTRCE